jgi:hypothetical protein
MTTTDDIITRCADYFLTILVEGDADFGSYDRFTHAMCLGAPEPRREWFVKRYETRRYEAATIARRDPQKRPAPKPWTPGNMAKIVDAYLRDCGIVHLGDDTDHSSLELALELSRLCDNRSASLVLGAIEHALDQLDSEDEAAESLASSDLARKWVAVAATSPIGWAA